MISKACVKKNLQTKLKKRVHYRAGINLVYVPQLVDILEKERAEPLSRVFTGLPNDFLAAMIEGLEEADVITPGRLFGGDSGGCAVGVTLRVIDPDFRGPGRFKVWSRRKTVKRAYRGLESAFPKLKTLECVFDRSVATAVTHFPDADQTEIARDVAHWVARKAQTELLLREMHSEWMNAIVYQRNSSADAQH